MPSSRYYRFKMTSREEKVKKLKTLFFSIGICCLFLVIIWAIFLSPIFKIKNIDIISDNMYLNRDDILKTISYIAPLGFFKENLLILPKSNLKFELSSNFPAITDIIIKKKLFNTLVVNFKKRIPVGILCHPNGDQLQSDSCYYFDKEGIVFASAPQTEGSLILKITDLSKNEILLGAKVLDNSRINFITIFRDTLNEIDKFKILEFRINPNSSVDFEAITDTGWLIYLDNTQDPKITVNNLLTILDEAVKNMRNLKYIDLRIPSRIFYKLK